VVHCACMQSFARVRSVATSERGAGSAVALSAGSS
jgi:hypothetical protein